KEGRNPNAVFDTEGYLNAYADVKAAGIDPLMHYDQSGWKEGRDPSKSFDSTAYLGAYGDVAQAKLDPMQHYLQYGATEGRSAFADTTFGAGTIG
ncbi:calcium-binding protein, partial [Methylobacterium tarhaniae]